MPKCGRKVLFVCYANTCRSPIAEAVFRSELNRRDIHRKWEVDSAGIINWTRGRLPDLRAEKVLESESIPLHHVARQVNELDFQYYDFILAMDHSNISHLNEMKPINCKASIRLFGSFDPERQLIIRDPFFDKGDEGFKACMEQCMRCSKAFLDNNFS